MAENFRMLFEGIRDAANQMMLAQAALVQAGEAALAAHQDHHDVRESVERLESFVMAQGEDLRALRSEIADARQEIRQLRERLNGTDPQ